MTVVALTIAGSDPSGGAGIQADLRTFAALGVVGVSAITALTVQNSLGVQSVHPVPADVLAAQLGAIFSDIKVDAVKIGMLGGADQVRAVAAALQKYSPPNIVLDPVLASTGGVPLLDEEGRHALLTVLMPLCDLITPNVPELGELTGMATSTENERDAAARQLLSWGAQRVLVKGGHLTGPPDDVLYYPTGERRAFRQNRVETPHIHGAGCLLSSAIAGYLSVDNPLEKAVWEAKNALTKALFAPVVIGQGRGYPNVAQGVLPRLMERMTHEQRLAWVQGVYVVTDTQMRPDESAEGIIFAAIRGGSRVVQLREKSLAAFDVLRSAETVLRSRFADHALLLINDRVDIVLAANADGVHVGLDDIRPEDARRLLGASKLVGVSVSTVAEAEYESEWASYFGVGAIFGSKTKLDAGEPVGVGRIREIKAAFPHIPLVAIGGINAENIGEVAAAGADAAAVVSAVVAAPDMEAATRELARLFEAGKPG